MKPVERLVHGYLQQRALLDRLVEANDPAELEHRLGEIKKLLPLLPQVLRGEPTADFPNVCLVLEQRHARILLVGYVYGARCIEAACGAHL